MRAFLNDLQEHWEGWAAMGLLIVAIMMSCSGCNQMWDHPGTEDGKPPNFLGNFLLSEEHAKIKRAEKAVPGRKLADRMTR